MRLDDKELELEEDYNQDNSMWELLVDEIMKGEVIPIIGENIVLGEKNTVSKILIKHLSKKEGITSDPLNYSQLLFDSGYKSDKNCIYDRLQELISKNQEKFIPSDLLKRILSIEQFPFIITTTIDYTIENTMREIWKKRGRDLKTKIFNNNPNELASLGDISNGTDIATPTIYYMFGKANSSRLHSFVITDEDMLSFCHSWLTEGKRPPILSGVLRNKFLLFLGCNYPDWLIRFIWYSMRQNLSNSGMLVDEGAEDSLIAFLDRMNVKAQRNLDLVVSEIERRVSERIKKDDKFKQPQMRTDVFISYSRKDSKQAEDLYNALTEKGLNVWYDRENLALGDYWWERIEGAIKTTKHFIPLLSKSMISQVKEAHVYRAEWNTAIEYAKQMSSKRNFIIPIIWDGEIDFYNEENILDLPERLLKSNAAIRSTEHTITDIAQDILNCINDLEK